MIKIAVIGAGITGYSSAVNVQRLLPGCDVTIIADQFGDQLVSYGAGGLFRPELSKLVDADNEKLIKQCLRDSWNHYVGLATSQQAMQSGQMLVPGLLSHRRPMNEDYGMLKEVGYDLRLLSDEERRQRGIPEEFKYTYSFTSVVSQMGKYIPWLRKQFVDKGGKFEKRTVGKLEELYGKYHLIINCCGDRAQTFMNDSECFPTRGQLARVTAPWFRHYHYFDTDVYMIPHEDKLNIGGIRIHGDANKKVDPKVTETILKNAHEMYPRLKGAPLHSTWAHSRPGRTRPRIEPETLKIGKNKQLMVIHNYGHGGNGITLSWGCGLHVARLAKVAVQTLTPKAAL